MEQEFNTVAIVGAGASGCICAYYLIKAGINVVLFDKGSVLRTLLPTGGGRCNLAHAEFEPKELARNYPRGEKFLYSVFSKFSTYDTLALFEELEVETYIQEDNRIFPVSNSAKDVRLAILDGIKKAKIIKKEIKSFQDLKGFGTIVIATGGHSGYELAKEADIKIIEPKPSLVGLNTKEDFKELSGTVIENVVCKEFDLCQNVLFTHFGISGPLIYKISSMNAYRKFPYELRFDLCPNLVDLQQDLNIYPHKDIKNILAKYLPQKIVNFILKDLNPDTKSHNIDGKTRDLILERIHNFKVSVIGTNKGEETVTAGGVDLDEINSKTMEAKRVPNLYFIGEVLNIDGFCGGFNLQNAWSTAYVCACGIIEKLEKDHSSL